MNGLEQAALDLLSRYGYVALFVVLALETAMILHFVPGELIVAAAAAELARSPGTLAAVVLVAAAGATAGCVLLYALTRYGGRAALEKLGAHGRMISRMERVFDKRAGEALVFVLRFTPVLRAVVTVPAALARMDPLRFTVFSAGGNVLFALIVAGSTYEAQRSGPVHDALLAARAWAEPRAWFLAVTALVILAAGAWAWLRRARLRRAPAREVAAAWRGAAIATLAAGIALALMSWLAPGLAGAIVDAIARDYAAWADAHGLTLAARALLAAGELLGIGLLALAATRAVRALVARAALRSRGPA